MAFAQTASNRTFARSSESDAFETFWRSLRGDNLIPKRSDFQPGKARRFLSDLVLVEVQSAQEGVLRIRVTGGRFDELVGSDLSGCNPADFFPEAYRADTVASFHLLDETPCGLWQITPAHLVRGYAVHLEITMFPLAPDQNGSPFLLCHVQSLGDLMRAHLPTPNGLGLDTAAAFEFLDVGAGVPVWVSKAA
jgi:hypothetical protein